MAKRRLNARADTLDSAEYLSASAAKPSPSGRTDPTAD
jgi:hypothetical protein